MLKKELLEILNEILELEAGTLKGSERLSELDWTSLAILGFIAAIDEKYEIALSPSDILSADTVENLVVLVENQVAEVMA